MVGVLVIHFKGLTYKFLVFLGKSNGKSEVYNSILGAPNFKISKSQ